ncbi:MAG: HlyD family efflux transporter periplasmic adaptor subunit [Magnetococcales bacterium]|nr:HlyD family efflux transporter periplasmic adaptor subunit [Magnetococcales bacterium]
MNAEPDARRLALCAALLDLERSARQAENRVALRFLMVNRLQTLLPADTVLFWHQEAEREADQKAGQGRIAGASGVSEPDPRAPMILWAKGICALLARGEQGRRSHAVTAEECPGEWGESWSDLAPPHGLWIPLITPDHTWIGGLLAVREPAWSHPEQELAERLGETFAHAWNALRPQPRHRVGTRRLKIAVAMAGVIGAGWIPVEQSALAPATVVPAEPVVIAAPLDGVIESLAVEPNARVRAGDLLFRMEATALNNRREMARLALETAQAERFKGRQLSFADPEAKASLPLLEARLSEKRAEADYAESLLQRAETRSPLEGVALFSDPNVWRGRPVTVGEKVMIVADGQRVEMEIRLPVADAVVLTPGAKVALFLHVDPLHPLEGELTRAAHDAELTPEGVLAYRIVARFLPGTPPPRMGLKGTAKIIGERVNLFYHLFRRPLAALRQSMGL